MTKTRILLAEVNIQVAGKSMISHTILKAQSHTIYATFYHNHWCVRLMLKYALKNCNQNKRSTYLSIIDQLEITKSHMFNTSLKVTDCKYLMAKQPPKAK